MDGLPRSPEAVQWPVQQRYKYLGSTLRLCICLQALAGKSCCNKPLFQPLLKGACDLGMRRVIFSARRIGNAAESDGDECAVVYAIRD